MVFFQNTILESPELRKTVEKWLDQNGQKVEFYCSVFSEEGTPKQLSKEEVIEKILEQKTDFCPFPSEPETDLKQETKPEKMAVGEKTKNALILQRLTVNVQDKCVQCGF